MAGNNYLLDTVIVIGYFNGEAIIRQKVAGLTIYVPSIVIGELYFGAYNSQQVSQNVARIRIFTGLATVLPSDEATADQYGQIKQGLRAKGRPIPENDIWIAAVAMQYGLTLATRDQHFQQVNGLLLDIW
jgi:tRNA(fMet)-specific endonuclease VapC